MPLNPISHHAYILPGGEKVFTYSNSRILERITKTKGNLLRKAERNQYKEKLAMKLYDKWAKELRETSTKYYQCVLHIKDLFRLQTTGQPLPNQTTDLVKRLLIKRSSSRPRVATPPEAEAPRVKTPRPPKRSRIPVSTQKTTQYDYSSGKHTNQKKIPKFLKHEKPSPLPSPIKGPVTPTRQSIWSPRGGSVSGRISRAGTTTTPRRRPRTAPNEKVILMDMKDVIRRKINFQAV
ncbi:hypothetical protein TWF281_003758 [Arthrobotrys megalospora]